MLCPLLTTLCGSLAQRSLLPLGVEGENSADWIVVDLGDVIVHVMQEESRRLYELEKLWS